MRGGTCTPASPGRPPCPQHWGLLLCPLRAATGVRQAAPVPSRPSCGQPGLAAPLVSPWVARGPPGCGREGAAGERAGPFPSPGWRAVGLSHAAFSVCIMLPLPSRRRGSCVYPEYPVPHRLLSGVLEGGFWVLLLADPVFSLSFNIFNRFVMDVGEELYVVHFLLPLLVCECFPSRQKYIQACFHFLL